MYWYYHLTSKLHQPASIASLVVMRLVFGSIMLWQVYLYFNNGWIHRHYIDPVFYFKYFGFEWVHPLSGDGMYYVFGALGILAFFILVGFLYRASALCFFILFCYVFLLDQSRYLNHFYMVILFSFLMPIVPAHRTFSIDSWLRPKIRTAFTPQWAVWIFRFQMEVILIFAGIVKINPDWLRLEPLKSWLGARADYPLVGPLFTMVWSVAFAAYGIIIFHIIGAPLLLWKRTRMTIFIIYCGFHMMNAWVFNIGIFPWLTMFAMTIFFDPDWPLQLIHNVRRKFNREPLRLYRRLQILSGLEHEQIKTIFPGDTGAGCSDGLRT